MLNFVKSTEACMNVILRNYLTTAGICLCGFLNLLLQK